MNAKHTPTETLDYPGVYSDLIQATDFVRVCKERDALLARIAELEAACEAALTLLTDPDADGFRANEIEAELRAALKGAGK